MNKDNLSRILSIISVVVALSFAVGSFITNSFLSTYNLIDFNLLKPHAIITGLLFFAILLAHVQIFVLFIDTAKIGNNSLIKTAIVTAFKVMYLSVLLLIFFEINLFFDPFYKSNFFGHKFDIKLFCFICFMPFPACVVQYYRWRRADKRDFIDWTYFIPMGLGIISVFILFFLFFNFEVFQSIFWFEILLGAAFIMIVVQSPSDDEKEKTKYKGLFFTKEPGITTKFQGILVIILFVICLLPLVLFIIDRYTKTIYPKINQSIGGGKLEEISYIVNGDTITGNKAYESEKFIFLINKDSSITKIDWDEVEKVMKPLKKKKRLQLHHK